MENMNAEIASMDELLQTIPTVRYGDWRRDAVRGGALHLSAVLPAVSAAIGHPVATRIHHDPEALRVALGVPKADSVIVALVDGLGYWNLRMRVGHSPYLRALLRDESNDRPIATCAPSTTVAAMAAFGTGTCPGLTGMAGYTQRNTQTGELSQLIQFDNAIAPLDLQREPTVFETLRAAGVRVTSCGLPKFADSPADEGCRCAVRTTRAICGRCGRVRAACEASKTPGLTYLYIRDADKVGHAYGWESEQWTAVFERVDEQLAQLHRLAPRGTLIVIVADHGMVGRIRTSASMSPRIPSSPGAWPWSAGSPGL